MSPQLFLVSDLLSDSGQCWSILSEIIQVFTFVSFFIMCLLLVRV